MYKHINIIIIPQKKYKQLYDTNASPSVFKHIICFIKPTSSLNILISKYIITGKTPMAKSFINFINTLSNKTLNTVYNIIYNPINK